LQDGDRLRKDRCNGHANRLGVLQSRRQQGQRGIPQRRLGLLPEPHCEGTPSSLAARTSWQLLRTVRPRARQPDRLGLEDLEAKLATLERETADAERDHMRLGVKIDDFDRSIYLMLTSLPNFHDAEDACQATFLVLARKAASVRKSTSISTWLHGVACRVVANMKRDHARRKARERANVAADSKDPVAEVSWREAQLILDQELEQLPARYRAPLILCYLECMTRDEAAQQLLRQT
jgi:RNA polymerase sigma factor (sigma-70 family)